VEADTYIVDMPRGGAFIMGFVYKVRGEQHVSELGRKNSGGLPKVDPAH